MALAAARSFGHSTWPRKTRNTSPSMADSTVMVASMPVWSMAPRMVRIFQWPPGTRSRMRRPFEHGHKAGSFASKRRFHPCRSGLRARSRQGPRGGLRACGGSLRCRARWRGVTFLSRRPSLPRMRHRCTVLARTPCSAAFCCNSTITMSGCASTSRRICSASMRLAARRCAPACSCQSVPRRRRSLPPSRSSHQTTQPIPAACLLPAA